MYIANIHIRNYRCFRDTSVDLRPGLNVIIGENNSGKTALLRALGLIFERGTRVRPDVHDFHQSPSDYSVPPEIEIQVTLRSSERDTLDDRAVVATWLTKLESPWEATLTYRFFLPDENHTEFSNAAGDVPTQETFSSALEALLPKYVSRIFGGDKTNLVSAEPEHLQKFEFHFLGAIRDVESEMFSGRNPLLRSMVTQVLDWDVADNPAEKANRRQEFRRLSSGLHEQLRTRLSLEDLFALVEDTGASDGGSPELSGQTDENDLISSLRLFLKRTNLAVPASHNGLGYNNLIYVSLLLASLDFAGDQQRLGQNAILFPILAVEEPEAHLHPALQYKLLKYIQKRLEGGDTAGTSRSRQVFLTTHSTQITAASGLEPLIHLSIGTDASVHVAYPARAFPTDATGVKSRKHVERYLDATKSNMLFAKGVLLVEGLAEQLLIPCLAEYVGTPLEQHHVAIVAVDGVAFRHFLPLFGGCHEDARKHSLRIPLACLVDADPSRKQKNTKNARHHSCWPYQLDKDTTAFEYRPVSFTLDAIMAARQNAPNIEVCFGQKTLEYDLAVANASSTCLVVDELQNAPALTRLAENAADCDDSLSILLAEAGVQEALQAITDEQERFAARFATCYLASIGSKGSAAFDLMHKLRINLQADENQRAVVNIPNHIERAIRWATRQPTNGT